MKKLVYFLMFGLAFTASQAAYGNTVAEVTAGMTMVGSQEGVSNAPCVRTNDRLIAGDYGEAEVLRVPMRKGAQGQGQIDQQHMTPQQLEQLAAGMHLEVITNSFVGTKPQTMEEKQARIAKIEMRILEANRARMDGHPKNAGCDEDEGEFRNDGGGGKIRPPMISHINPETHKRKKKRAKQGNDTHLDKGNGTETNY